MNDQLQSSKHWIFFDGECPMCRRCMHWAIRRDKGRQFVAWAYQNAPSPPMTPELRRACEGAVHVITKRGKVLRGAAAVVFLFQHIVPKPLGFVPRILAQAPWIWPLDIGYELVARNRMRIGCFVLPNEPRAPLENFQHEDASN